MKSLRIAPLDHESSTKYLHVFRTWCTKNSPGKCSSSANSSLMLRYSGDSELNTVPSLEGSQTGGEANRDENSVRRTVMRMLVRSLQENQAPLRWRGWEAGVDREALSEKLTSGLSLRPPAISQGKGGGTGFMKGGSFKRSLACPAPAPTPV